MVLNEKGEKENCVTFSNSRLLFRLFKVAVMTFFFFIFTVKKAETRPHHYFSFGLAHTPRHI